jgi:hypothetical protein
VRPCDHRLFLPFRASVSIERAASPDLLRPRLTSLAPSHAVADAVVGFVPTGRETSQVKSWAFPSGLAGFTVRTSA